MEKNSQRSDSVPEPGLPPVTPPTGRFLAQLFLVPGMIVAVAVLLLLLFRALIGGGYTPDGFLRQLDSDNADVRWRGASDLAQVLKRKESVHLTADPHFALELAERLRRALDELNEKENEVEAVLPRLGEKERTAAWRKLNPLRDSVSFLAGAMADFHIPVGVPILGEMMLRKDSADVVGTTQLRRHATWSMAVLGENTRGFQDLPKEKREAILEALVKEAAGNSPRSHWARTGLWLLDKSRLPAGAGSELIEPDRLLAEAAKSKDRFQREQVAFALNFWDGPLAEPTLLMLAHDKGDGTLLRASDEE